MKVIGVTAEYNPFHTGHGYQIAESRRILGGDTAVVAVMSGHWVQQADCAIGDKWTRARLALMGGADLVLELPTPWATASAERFCRGAVTLLNASGVVDFLSFGSECGDVERLQKAADCLDSGAFRESLRLHLNEGLSFPAARQRAVEELAGTEIAALLSGANNNLGVEYMRSLNALQSEINPLTVTRQGAGHNTFTEDLPFASATQIRHHLRGGDFDAALPYLIPGGAEILRETPLSYLKYIERPMLAKIRTMTADDWAALPDSGQAEGLPRRLEKAAMESRSVEEFLEKVKTKRYTHARLRRLMLWAYLGLTTEDFPQNPPYLRVLGFNERGQVLLKQMKKAAALPVLTKPAHARALDEAGRRLFEIEARCTDLYDLCFDEIPAPGREWTTDPVRLAGL